MKKHFIILIILISFITGCSKYRELNHLSIISTITIDYKDGEYHLTLQEILPEKGENKVDYNYKYHESTSPNLSKAFNNIIGNSPKDIYLEKVQNVIISEKEKDKITKEFFKYLKKEKNINPNSNYIISKGNLKKVLKISNDYNYLSSILKSKKQNLLQLEKKIKKKQKLKVPVIKIDNKEILFVKYNYLQV